MPLRTTATLLLSLLLVATPARPGMAQTAAAPDLDTLLDEARQSQAAEHYKEAAAAYGKATALEPRIAELWANRGLMEHLAGDPRAALTSFGRALALKPGLFTALLFSGVDHVALGEPEPALPLLQKALAAQPRNPEAMLASAKAHAALHQWRRAAAAYQTATDLQPENPAAWYGLAISSLGVIDDDGGSLARTQASSAWARALYADELLTQGRTGEAVALYQQLAPAATPAVRAKLLRVLEHSEGDGAAGLSPETRAALQQALASNAPAAACGAEINADPACAFLAGDFAAAAHGAAAVLSTKPSDPEALFWSVKSNERRAVFALARFEQLSPQSPVTFDLAGDLFRRRSLPERARAEYSRALAIDPHDPAALLGTAAAHLAENHTAEALATAQTALADRPEDPRLNLIAGESLVAQHQFPSAESFLRKVLPDRTLAPRAHALLGRVAAERGDTQTAIAEMRLGLPSDRDGSLHFQLFRLLRKTGDLSGAQVVEAQARALQASRLANAVTAVQSSPQPPP